MITVLLIAHRNSSALILVRQWQRTWERNVDTAYEEYLQMQLEHYLEAENLEVQQIEDEYNEQVNRLEQIK